MYSYDRDNSSSSEDVSDVNLDFFQFSDYESQSGTIDMDPDNNIFKILNNNCAYYTDKTFNKINTLANKLSIVHFNSRSLYKNFESIKDSVPIQITI